MTPKERAAMQQALEALENERSHMTANWDNIVKAITALKEALAEPDMNLSCKSVQARLATSWGYVKAEQAEQEPVAWIEIERGIPMFVRFADKYKPNCDGFIQLYGAAIRTKDLTDDEIRAMFNGYVAPEILLMFRAVIAADREKNK